MSEYCLWKANCVLMRSKKIARDSLDTYLCCHSCKDSRCEYRCKDPIETCKYLSDKKYTEYLISKNTQVATSSLPKRGDKKPQELAPTEKSTPQLTPKQKSVDTLQVSVNIPQSKSELAKLLGISYDKVAYRIEVKHKTYEEVYKEFKK